MTKLQLLHQALNEHLMTTVEQIMALVSETVLEYEAETVRVRMENEALRRKLVAFECPETPVELPDPTDAVSLSLPEHFSFKCLAEELGIKQEPACDLLCSESMTNLITTPNNPASVAEMNRDVTMNLTQSYMAPVEFELTEPQQNLSRKQKCSFTCHICDKVFARKTTLDIHKRVHSKPYDLCNNKTDQEWKRNQHRFSPVQQTKVCDLEEEVEQDIDCSKSVQSSVPNQDATKDTVTSEKSNELHKTERESNSMQRAELSNTTSDELDQNSNGVSNDNETSAPLGKEEPEEFTAETEQITSHTCPEDHESGHLTQNLCEKETDPRMEDNFIKMEGWTLPQDILYDSDDSEFVEEDDGDPDFTLLERLREPEEEEHSGLYPDDPDNEDSEPEADPQPSCSQAQRKFRWRKTHFVAPCVDFIEEADADMEGRISWSPYQYFKNFVTDDIVQEAANETNRYSVQKNGDYINTNPKELEQMLGIYLHMGLIQMPSVRSYWESETEIPTVSEVMSGTRFQKLMAHVQFRDNRNVSEEDKRDRLWKLRPWMEKLRQRFLTVPPEERHAVGEVTVPFKGKSPLRCYTPGKPHKWGFKMWGRAGQSGFLYDFDVCQGARHSVKSHGGDVLLQLTATLPTGRNHKVFADKNFTSVPSVEHLKQRGIYFVGTVRMSRVEGCALLDEDQLKRKGRGSVDFRVCDEDIVVVRWLDNKPVNLLSSFVGVEPMEMARGWDWLNRCYTMVPRPAILGQFNKYMSGVELLVKLTSLYKYNFRSRRWYMYIWWHSITLAVINAWLLYKRDLAAQTGAKPLPLRRFQVLIATSLTTAGKSVKRGRLSSSPRPTPASQRKRKYRGPPTEVRSDNIGHFAVFETRQRCKYCTGHFSSIKCLKCNVHLCQQKNRNCFWQYHSTV